MEVILFRPDVFSEIPDEQAARRYIEHAVESMAMLEAAPTSRADRTGRQQSQHLRVAIEDIQRFLDTC